VWGESEIKCLRNSAEKENEKKRRRCKQEKRREMLFQSSIGAFAALMGNGSNRVIRKRVRAKENVENRDGTIKKEEPIWRKTRTEKIAEAS